MQHNVSLNDNDDPQVPDGCGLVVARLAVAGAALVYLALTAYSGYARLTDEETHAYALKVQREWHWSGYTEAERRAILDRVERLIAKNPKGYLAKVARQVYR